MKGPINPEIEKRNSWKKEAIIFEDFKFKPNFSSLISILKKKLNIGRLPKEVANPMNINPRIIIKNIKW